MNDAAFSDVTLRDICLRVGVENPIDRAFWTETLRSGWEDTTFDFVEAYVGPGKVFLDIGGWIGPISLYAASRGARVIVLEPDPVAHASLSRNVSLNAGRLAGPIEVLNAAFDARRGSIKIFGNVDGFGTSTSSSIGKGEAAVEVPTLTPDDLIAMTGRQPVVAKVDIEAHEFFCADAIVDLRARLEAPLHLSLHPNMLRKTMGWRRWVGLADGDVARRTAAILAAFSDCRIRATTPPESVTGDDLQRRLRPSKGRIRDFEVIVTGPDV